MGSGAVTAMSPLWGLSLVGFRFTVQGPKSTSRPVRLTVGAQEQFSLSTPVNRQ